MKLKQFGFLFSKKELNQIVLNNLKYVPKVGTQANILGIVSKNFCLCVFEKMRISVPAKFHLIPYKMLCNNEKCNRLRFNL